jgi:tRNA(adenine34) deaminase|tara:strand:- start:555 stop:1001 length:447 start_codon:yes stop_codon:yes gene_type:complete
MLQPTSHEHFMKQALIEAQKAFDADEVPVGAVIVCNNAIIAKTHNFTERLTDFTAHAEMQAFTSASDYLGNKYLDKCTLYVTLEPCTMCAGASFWTRIGKIVYGAADERRGYKRITENVLHPSTEVIGGVLEEEARNLMKTFFQNKRE